MPQPDLNVDKGDHKAFAESVVSKAFKQADSQDKDKGQGKKIFSTI